ncbi:extracellular solute-binding protein [Catalinimonas niigatensis]|uniref:extracellular solute-binding protein n=1 Tax=Catalinimonas niigatensis TaxID=1397264 RepID=UPI002664EC8E|nr:extracellular solute-binding protein [Catalinimonas niigatensis]WPP53614.1 extracellular solute-binding protein [Catalinimonas niigatensis]
MNRLYCFFIFLISSMFACDSSTHEVQRGEVINVYSNTLTSTDKALFTTFERASGIKVNIISETANLLMNRLIQQQQDSMLADLILLEGISYLQQAKQAGLLDTLSQGSIVNTIPVHLRDTNLQWLSLGYSANVIGYLQDSVDTLQVRRYADLADPQWKNKLGWGTKTKAIYQSQLAAMLADEGEDATTRWINGLAENIISTNNSPPSAARLSTISDTSAWLGLINTAEYAKSIDGNKPGSPGLVFPSPEAYLHITGVAITNSAPHPARARLLLNYLFSREVIQQYANMHYLYPARPDAEVPPRVSRLGEFRADTTSQTDIARFADEAERLLNSSGWR